MKTKLSILLLFFCLNLFGQVPNTTTFSLQDVVDEMPIIGAVARVDLVTKSTDANNCTVHCNGYFETMVWSVNKTITVTDFVNNYFASFGAVTLTDNTNGSFTFTANVPGIDFEGATIDGTGNTAVNITANNTGTISNNLIGCFTDAIDAYFDPEYKGDKTNLLNFRNYHAPPITYTNWYVPTMGNLLDMYVQLKTYNLGNFLDAQYWSSQSISDPQAEYRHFANGDADYTWKTSLLCVRCVQAFQASMNKYSLRDVGPAGGLIFYVSGGAGPTWIYGEATLSAQEAININWYDSATLCNTLEIYY